MMSLNRLAQTVATTSNFSTAILSRQSKQRVPIKFRDGNSFNLTWAQYVNLRDNYQAMRGFKINQIDNDLFRVKNEKIEVTAHAQQVNLLLRVNSKYNVEQTEEGLFKVNGDNFELIGTPSIDGLIFLVNEYLNGDYKYECANKTVLDIGGYQGETAVFFSLLGAKKIIIYEPVLSHHRLIKQNIEKNHVNAEVHGEGIGPKNETITLSYDEISTGLGIKCTGTKKMDIKVRNITEVIKSSDADIAKIDCEGSEECLTEVPNSTLRKIECYMIEAHSAAIKKALIEKFTAAGFEVTKNTKGDPCSLVWFERKQI